MLGKLLLGGILLSSFISLGTARPETQKSTVKIIAPRQTTLASAAAGALQQKTFYNGLPVHDVQVAAAPTAGRYAILLPQYHRTPGSNAADSVNDVAAQAQSEMYSVVAKIIDTQPVSLVMVEGELTGVVSTSKRTAIEQKITQRNNFSKALDQLRTAAADQPLAALGKSVVNEGGKLLEAIDRSVILAGAPFKLWAENKPLLLVGAENAETLKNSETIARDYIYVQDRLAALKPVVASQKTSASASLSTSLAPQASSASFNEQQFMLQLYVLQLKAVLFGNMPVVSALQTIGSVFKSLITGTAVASNKIDAPLRSDNPYNSIVDVNVLESQLVADEQKINSIILEQRSSEAAANFAQALTTHNQTIGLITYGAQHEESLIKALNKEGVTVITVTTNAVAAHHTR